MDIEAVSALSLMAICLVMLTRLIIEAIKVYDEETFGDGKEDEDL